VIIEYSTVGLSDVKIASRQGTFFLSFDSALERFALDMCSPGAVYDNYFPVEPIFWPDFIPRRILFSGQYVYLFYNVDTRSYCFENPVTGDIVEYYLPDDRPSAEYLMKLNYYLWIGARR
jgi:hypothetical protein